MIIETFFLIFEIMFGSKLLSPLIRRLSQGVTILLFQSTITPITGNIESGGVEVMRDRGRRASPSLSALGEVAGGRAGFLPKLSSRQV